MYTGSEASTPPIMRMGWEWVNTAVPAETPFTDKVSAEMTHSTRPITTPTPTATSGASNKAQAAFDSTICVSDTGSDFQNRMLRSRRSSYSEPSA